MKTAGIVGYSLAAFLLIGLSDSISNAQPAVGSLEGRVLHAISGAPVKDAAIRLEGPFPLPAPNPTQRPNVPEATAVTDGRGHFNFAGLQPGEYLLEVRRPGFEPRVVGSWLRHTDMVRIPAGGAVKDLAVRIVPYSVVSGQILDENGAPVQHAGVAALSVAYQPGGRMTFVRAGRRMQTDDRGMYRLTELLPESYVLQVTPPAEFTRKDPAGKGYPVTYNGDVTDFAAAPPLEIGMASTLTVNVRLRKVPVGSIRGRIVGVEGLGKGPAIILVSQSLQVNCDFPLAGALTANLADGNFEISGLPLGVYHVLVESPTNMDVAQRQRGAQVLDVKGDIEGAKIRVTAGVQVHGSVKLEGAAQALPRSAAFHLAPLGNFRQAYSAPVHDDLTFELPSVPLGRYTPRITLPLNGYLKSASAGGKEIGAEGFEVKAGEALPVTLTLSAEGAAQLDAAAVDRDGKPLFRRSITLIPLDGSPLSAREAMTDLDGKAIFWSVRPGKYLATAWDSAQRVELVEAQGTDALKPVEAWSRIVTVEANGKGSIQLTPVSAADARKAFRAQ